MKIFNKKINIKKDREKKKKERKLLTFSKLVAFFMTIIMILESIPLGVVYADSRTLRWLETQTISDNLNIENEKKDNSILLTFDLKDEGRYILSFFTPDKATYNSYNTANGTNYTGTAIKHEIIFRKEFVEGVERLRYSHAMKIDDGSGNFDIDITEMFAKNLNLWDKNAQPFAKYVYQSGLNKIEYLLTTEIGQNYMINEQAYKFIWLKQAEGESINMCLQNIKGIEDGTIYDFELENADASVENLTIFKKMKIESEPTRWEILPSGEPKEIDCYKTVDGSEITNKTTNPGIRLKVSTPRRYSASAFDFVDLPDSEVGGMPITLNMNSTKGEDYNLDQISGVKLGDYQKTDDKKYILDIIGNDNASASSYSSIREVNTGNTVGNVPRKYIYRKKITESAVYDTTAIVVFNDRNINTNLRLYTYLLYNVIRKNIDETYLEITPYKYPGTYEIYVTTTKDGITKNALFGTSTNKWAEQQIKDIGNTETVANYSYIPEKIYIPVDVARNIGGSQSWNTLGICFRESGLSKSKEGVKSEVTYYDANADKNITVDVPDVKSATNVVVLTDKEGNPRVAKYDLNWGIPAGLFDDNGNYRILKPGEKLWYEIYMNTASKNIIRDVGSEEYRIIDVISLERQNDPEGKILLRSVSNPSWSKELTRKDTQITAEILLKPLDEAWRKDLKPDWLGLNNDISKPLLSEHTSGKIGAYKTNDTVSYGNKFFDPDEAKVPGNYFVTVKGYYDPKGEDGNLTISDFGVPTNVVLEPASEIIPVPEKIKITGKSKTNIKVDIEKVDISRYKEIMLDPLESQIKGHNGNVEYEIFIAKDEKNLRKLLSSPDIRNQKRMESQTEYKYINKDNDVFIAFQDGNINDLTYHDVTIGEDSSSMLQIDHLRNGGIYSFRSETPYINFTSLDSNTTYFVAARTALNVRNKIKTTSGETYEDEDIYSEVSKVYFDITNSDAILPEEGEKTPPTPLNFELNENPEDKRISVKWNEPELIEETGVTYGYELVRVANTRLKDEDRSNILSIVKIIKNGYKEFKAYRVEDKKLYAFDESTNTFVDATTKTNSTFNYDVITDNFIMNDVDVNPNKIYYYYLRTIKHANGGQVVNSEWTELTATTVPIDGIMSLREVVDGTSYGIPTYDKMYERLIAFEAPKADAVMGTTSARLPSKMDFKISMKEFGEIEYYDAEVPTLCAIAATEKEDIATYVYKLSKLKSGSKYYVRVAVLDTSQEAGEYGMSKFSDTITVRTEFSQDDYDKKNKYDQYEQYYDTLLNKLTNDLAFVLEDTDEKYTLKYKEERMLGDITSTPETTYMLKTNDEAEIFTYYISNACIDELVRLRKGIKIIKGDTTIVIPYNFLSKEYTKEYADLLEKVEDLHDKVEDFSLMLKVEFKSPSSYVDTYKTISDEAIISMKLVEQDTLNMDIDFKMNTILEDKIAENKIGFMERLDKYLKGKENDKKFLSYVEEEKNKVYEEVIKKIAKEIRKFDLDSYSLDELNNPINIKIKTNDVGSKIFAKYNGEKWISLKTFNSLGASNAYIDRLGRVVLASAADTNSLYGSDKDKNSYYTKSKYDLSDVLIRNGSYYPQTDSVSKKLFLDVAFSLYQVDSNNVFELAKQKKELDSSFVFYNDILTRQECVYGVLELYNKFNKADLDKVIISNASSIVKLDIENYYKQKIYAGLQLGLIGYNDINNPRGKMTVNELLDLIYRVIDEE